MAEDDDDVNKTLRFSCSLGAVGYREVAITMSLPSSLINTRYITHVVNTMKFLQELVRFTRVDDEDIEDDQIDDLVGDENDLSPSDEFSEEDPSLEGGEEMADDFQDEMPEEPSEPEDPNRQGMIRTVKGAHLVYKREVEDGTYHELWQYNISTLRDEITIRKAILAGTDIPVNKAQSPDGSQSFETWAAGNAELLLVKGLPS